MEPAEWSKRESFENFAGLKSSSLLRGIPLHRAMQRFGVLFSTASSASATTSDPSSFSIKTEILQDFISHNWVTSRTEKFLCLAIHYNLTLATCAFWGVAALCCVLTMVGVFPVYVPANSIPTCYASKLGGQIAFFVALFGAQDLQRLLHRLGLAGRGRLLFVDKACINQVDPVRQREGIESLAGFLLASQNIVVVYGPTYLYKLWTVYELATFVMAHHDHSRIKVLPTMWLRQHCAFVIGLSLAQLLYYTLLFSWRVPLGALLAYLISALLLSAMGGYFIRQWQRQQANITAAIEAFSIRKTNCAVESDRIQVQDNVRTFLQCLGRVSSESAEDALDEFDKLVREVLPRALVASIGPTGTPYSHLIACTSMFIGAALDNVAARATSAPLSGTIAVVVFHTSGCLTLIPLAIFLIQKILARRLHLRGCADGLFIAAALFPGMSIYFVAYALEFMASRKAEQQDPWAWAYCAALLAYCALAAVVTVCVFVRNRRTPRPSRLFRNDAAAAGSPRVAHSEVAPLTPPVPPLTPPIPETSQWRGRHFSLGKCELTDVVSQIDTERSI